MNHASDFGYSIDGQLPSTETNMNTTTCTHGHDEYSAGTVCAQCEKEQEEAAYELRQAEWRKKEEEQRIAQIAADDKVRQKLCSAVNLQAPGMHKAELINHAIVIDGISLKYQVNIKEEYSSGWRPKPTGRIRVTVGDWGSRQSFVQLKDGTFSKACAEALIYEATRMKTAKERETRANANRDVVADFLADHPLSGYGAMRVSTSSSLEAPIRVELKMDSLMTVEDAAKLYDALMSVGLVGGK